jgi:hypothetical protein
LHRLWVAGLIRERRGGFAIRPKVVRAVRAFRRRPRRNRFERAEAFVQAAGLTAAVPRRVTIRRAEQQRAYD